MTAIKKTYNIKSRYQQYISELEILMKPSLKKKIKNVRNIDLQDYFFEPEKWFANDTEAKGFIISMLVKNMSVK